MNVKKDTLLPGVVPHKNLGQLFKQPEEHVMEVVEASVEGCNLIGYFIFIISTTVFSFTDNPNQRTFSSKAVQACINISKTVVTRSTQVPLNFKDATTSPIKFR
jgi:hypothetical protein